MTLQRPPITTPDSTSGGPSAVEEKTNAQTDALLRVLQLEADIREVETERELVFHMANESRTVFGFRQAFVFRLRSTWQLAEVSSVSAFDRNAPLNRDMRHVIEAIDTGAEGQDAHKVDLSDEEQTETLRTHVFPFGLWVPMRTRRGDVFAGVLVLRETPWPDAAIPLVRRVADTYAHAWAALAGSRLARRFRVPRRAVAMGLGALIAVLGFVQAPLTVLAPAEVTARDRATIAAALNGVLEEVLVSPNTVVEAGTVLARYDDTELRNALQIADRETVVARAQVEKLQNASFSDRSAAREIKVAEAELALALAESDLARERMSRVEIYAPRAGLVVIDSVQDLTGKPVSVGERLMEIVDPEELEFTIRLPVDDSIVLQEGARVRVFLDSNPLSPAEAVLSRRGYRATTQDDGSFAFSLTASSPSDVLDAARLGAQGTAQLFGEQRSLFFILFRRPISWARQTFGF